MTIHPRLDNAGGMWKLSEIANFRLAGHWPQAAGRALCGGGRYDNLVAKLGGEKIPAIGFAAGMERLIIAMKLKENQIINTDIYIINLEKKSIAKSMKLADDIRKNLGASVYIDSLRRSLKSQMRHANKMNAKFVIT